MYYTRYYNILLYRRICIYLGTCTTLRGHARLRAEHFSDPEAKPHWIIITKIYYCRYVRVRNVTARPVFIPRSVRKTKRLQAPFTYKGRPNIVTTARSSIRGRGLREKNRCENVSRPRGTLPNFHYNDIRVPHHILFAPITWLNCYEIYYYDVIII